MLGSYKKIVGLTLNELRGTYKIGPASDLSPYLTYFDCLVDFIFQGKDNVVLYHTRVSVFMPLLATTQK